MDKQLVVVSILVFLVEFSLRASTAIVGNPEEIGGNYEGDMILSRSQMRNLFSNARNGKIDKRYRWPKKNGVVTVIYEFDSDNDYNEDEKDRITDALRTIEGVSCIRFKQKSDDDDGGYIKVVKGRGCSSFVGLQSNYDYQRVTLGRGCLRSGTIMHEFLHALGFYHMQSSFNRDDHIKVLYENIASNHRHNFVKIRNTDISLYGTDYDLDSVMHYGKKYFSKNGRNTIETVDPGDIHRIGQRSGMSSGDIERLNTMYKC